MRTLPTLGWIHSCDSYEHRLYCLPLSLFRFLILVLPSSTPLLLFIARVPAHKTSHHTFDNRTARHLMDVCDYLVGVLVVCYAHIVYALDDDHVSSLIRFVIQPSRPCKPLLYSDSYLILSTSTYRS